MRLAAALLLLALTRPSLGRAAETSLDSELTGVVDLFYDLRFDEAQRAADRIVAEHPGHPAGPFFESVVAYQRFVSETQKRDETLRQFEDRSRQAIASAEAWISTDAAQGRYYLGAARGFRARVFAARRKYLRALPEALGGVRQLKKALALDPKLEDAYLGLGMYHYYRARMPAAAKPFAFLITGEGSSARQGLAELSRVAERGGAAKMEARSVLAAIYASDAEGRWDEAETLLAGLMERYPHNPLYRLRRVYVAEKRGRFDEAVDFADPDGAWLGALDPSLRVNARQAALYRAAEAAALGGRRADAARWLDALQAAGCPDDLAPWAARRRAGLAGGPPDPAVKPWTGLEAPR